MKNKKGIQPKISFKVAVQSTKDIAQAYESGLRALGKHSAKVQISDKSLCSGSVDIDSNVKSKYPQANRWDYAFCYNSEVYFIEVHSAYTNEVKTVKRKLQWLKDWLISAAPQMNTIKAKSKGPYFWIQSNGFHIPATAPQHREASQAGILPISKLIL